MQQFLPLLDHAHPLVIQNKDFDRQAMLNRRREFLNIHQNRRIPRDIHDQSIRMRDLCANRGRQTISHRPQSTRGHPVVRLIEFQKLSRPHLVLSNFRGNKHFALILAKCRLQPFQSILRLDNGL